METITKRRLLHFKVFQVLLAGQGGSDSAGSFREGRCPSNAVGAGSPPQGAGGETLKKAGAPIWQSFQSSAKAEEPGAFWKLRKEVPPPPSPFFKIQPPAPCGGGGRAPKANSIQSGRARLHFRPTAIALTGPLTHREAVFRARPPPPEVGID